MKSEKRKYLVNIYIYGQSGGEPFRRLYQQCQTYAVSTNKAENNVRYRTEGKAYWNEEHGQEDNWHGYEYVAREVN